LWEIYSGKIGKYFFCYSYKGRELGRGGSAVMPKGVSPRAAGMVAMAIAKQKRLDEKARRAKKRQRQERLARMRKLKIVPLANVREPNVDLPEASVSDLERCPSAWKYPKNPIEAGLSTRMQEEEDRALPTKRIINGWRQTPMYIRVRKKIVKTVRV
tara:strand:+ start:1236 stop:1706 length:471 start_codon:yes stop_codon:yes gene_type:complete